MIAFISGLLLDILQWWGTSHSISNFIDRLKKFRHRLWILDIILLIIGYLILDCPDITDLFKQDPNPDAVNSLD